MTAKRPGAAGWTVEQEIDFFFAPPVPQQPDGRVSRLHLYVENCRTASLVVS